MVLETRFNENTLRAQLSPSREMEDSWGLYYPVTAEEVQEGCIGGKRGQEGRAQDKPERVRAKVHHRASLQAFH